MLSPLDEDTGIAPESYRSYSPFSEAEGDAEGGTDPTLEDGAP